jgi:hypothetical protein
MSDTGMITSEREQYDVTVHLFICTGRSLGKITFMFLTFTVSQKASCRGPISFSPLSRFYPPSSSLCQAEASPSTALELVILLPDHAFHAMHTFILKPKLPGKHISCVFEDLQKRKAPNNKLGDVDIVRKIISLLPQQKYRSTSLFFTTWRT